MNTRSSLRALRCAGLLRRHLCTGLLLAPLVCGPASAAAEVTVIVNTANNASLDEEAIARIFLGQSRSHPGGAEANPVNQKDGSAPAEEFATRYLKKTSAQLRAYWARQVFTGGGKAPPALDGDDAVMKFVAATPGGIGYVESPKLVPGVKAVKK